MINNMRDAALEYYDNNFYTLWRKVFAEYDMPSNEGRMWLAGPTAYVFSLCDKKFAVDLQIRREKDFELVSPYFAEDLKNLEFVLITHSHDDHMCLPLMNALKDTDIHWYIPDDCNKELVFSSGLGIENITFVKPGDILKFGDITVRAFFSPHVKPGGEPFAQCGYELKSPYGNILMPADVRDYSFDDYPDFGEVDLCLSHVWGGNEALIEEQYLPMLEQFAKFSAAFRAKKYFFCHLYEIARPEDKIWTYSHVGIVEDMLFKYLPGSITEIPRLGMSYSVDFRDDRGGLI